MIAQGFKSIDPIATMTLAGPETGLDFRWAQPAAVLGHVVWRKPRRERGTRFGPSAPINAPRHARWTLERAGNPARPARTTSIDQNKACKTGAGNSIYDTGRVPRAMGQQHRVSRQRAGRRGQRDECHLPQPRRVKQRTEYDG